jgi:site-specific DNA-methyltransferase (adenine-specific)
MPVKPYYQDELITLYHGDSREIVPKLKQKFYSVITDPVWPNCPEGLLAGWENPYQLLRDVSSYIPDIAQVLVIMLGINSDPRFLNAVPGELPFFRIMTLDYVRPSYKGNLLIQGDIAYVFGKPKIPKGQRVFPGRYINNKPTKAEKRHPSTRRFEHMQFLIKWYGHTGPVLDPFSGSGTTLRACKLAGIPAVGIEIEEKYCKLT